MEKKVLACKWPSPVINKKFWNCGDAFSAFTLHVCAYLAGWFNLAIGWWCSWAMGSSEIDKSSKDAKETKESKTPTSQVGSLLFKFVFPVNMLRCIDFLFPFTSVISFFIFLAGFCRHRSSPQLQAQGLRIGLGFRFILFRHKLIFFHVRMFLVVHLISLYRLIRQCLHMVTWRQVLKHIPICGEFR